MRLRENFITHQSSSVHIMVSTDERVFNGLVRSNATAAFMLEMLKHETDTDEIVQALSLKYEKGREEIKEDVLEILVQLKQIGAIDD